MKDNFYQDWLKRSNLLAGAEELDRQRERKHRHEAIIERVIERLAQEAGVALSEELQNVLRAELEEMRAEILASAQAAQAAADVARAAADQVSSGTQEIQAAVDAGLAKLQQANVDYTARDLEHAFPAPPPGEWSLEVTRRVGERIDQLTGTGPTGRRLFVQVQRDTTKALAGLTVRAS